MTHRLIDRWPTERPVVVIGDGDYAHAWFAGPGGTLAERPDAPPAPVMLRPTRQPEAKRQPWRWSHFWFGFALAFVLAIFVVAAVIALSVSVIVTPLAWLADEGESL